MTKKYEKEVKGVINTETFEKITPKSPKWREYEEWLKQDSLSNPIFPPDIISKPE